MWSTELGSDLGTSTVDDWFCRIFAEDQDPYLEEVVGT